MIATEEATQGTLNTNAPNQRCVDAQEPPLILEEITIDELAAREECAARYAAQ